VKRDLGENYLCFCTRIDSARSDTPRSTRIPSPTKNANYLTIDCGTFSFLNSFPVLVFYVFFFIPSWIFCTDSCLIFYC
jgi:hypothetical protein